VADVRNIFAVTISLVHKGAIVEISLNGHETIERLEPHNNVDLVLMDVMMP
jgi:CheY-like chemotaxis protein